jgi:hypothetical protein
VHGGEAACVEDWRRVHVHVHVVIVIYTSVEST